MRTPRSYSRNASRKSVGAVGAGSVMARFADFNKSVHAGWFAENNMAVRRGRLGDEFDHLRAVAINQMPVHTVFHPVAGRVGRVNIRGHEQAAGSEHAVE